MNYNFRFKPSTKSKLYISKKTETNLQTQLLPSFIRLYKRRNIIDVIHVNEGEKIVINNLEIIPYTLPDNDTFLYKFIQNNKTVIYAPCDIRHFPIKKELTSPYLFILHLGFFEDFVP